MTRFNVASLPDEPDFDGQAWKEIGPGSQLRESIGFVPFEPGAPWLAGIRRFAARVRIDTLKPDPTGVRERFQDLCRLELEHGGLDFVGPKKRRELKNLAEEELLLRAAPRSRIIETVIDRGVLYVGSTANLHLGKIIQLYRRAGVVADFKTPWIDHGQAEATSEILEIHDPVQSAHGAHFLRDLVDDPEIKFEPIGGYVRLQNRHARISLTGAVLRDLYRFLEEDAELLAAKLVTAEHTFRFDALPFRISGCNIENSRHAHWIEQLDERLEGIESVWEVLENRYKEHRGIGKKRKSPVADLRKIREAHLSQQTEREPGIDDEPPPLPPRTESDSEVPF